MKAPIIKICPFCLIEFIAKRTKSVFCCRSHAQTYAANKPERIALSSLNAKARWTDATFRNHMLEEIKNFASSAEFKEKQSVVQKERQSHQSVKAEISKRSKEQWARQETKEKQSASQKIAQNKSDVKENKSHKLKQITNEWHWRKRQSQNMLNLWKNADYAERVFAGNKAAMYKRYDFILPSGTIVKLQGYEPRALRELLETYHESDIVIGVKEMNSVIGTISYLFESKERTYYPDFYIKSTNTIIEVKSTWTFESEKEKNIAKEQSCLSKGFAFKFIIY
ncbi:MAG: hypothetical protein WC979_02740 [Candidatus Pacearchaeota archaeon]|jgi:hypothetical protein|nr:hypothetical protein [Clostridia bacterium]